MAARTLASGGRSGVVGVVMHIDPHLLFSDPYFSRLLQGMSDVLSEQATGMMVWLGHRSKEETLERILSMGLLEGVIVTAHNLDDPLVDGLLASHLPTVLIGHRRADRSASYVDVDNIEAADNDHQPPGPARPPADRPRDRHARDGRRRGSDHRLPAGDGPGRACRATGLIVEGDFNRSSGMIAAAELLDRGVDAIFCANDASAAGALETIRARGLRVPEDVALAGFDDLEFAAQLDPPLTTIRQGVQQQGAEAAQALFQLLQDPDGGPRRVLLPTELVIRQSTDGRCGAWMNVVGSTAPAA